MGGVLEGATEDRQQNTPTFLTIDGETIYHRASMRMTTMSMPFWRHPRRNSKLKIW